VTIEKGREGDDGFDGGGMHVAACEDCRVCGVHHGTGTAGCSKCGVPAGGDR
jgi:hypothetical protein